MCLKWVVLHTPSLHRATTQLKTIADSQSHSPRNPNRRLWRHWTLHSSRTEGAKNLLSWQVHSTHRWSRRMEVIQRHILLRRLGTKAVSKKRFSVRNRTSLSSWTVVVILHKLHPWFNGWQTNQTSLKHWLQSSTKSSQLNQLRIGRADKWHQQAPPKTLQVVKPLHQAATSANNPAT